MEKDKSSEDDFMSAVALHAPQLQQSLEQGDLEAAAQIIAQISQVRESALYREVGRLTRELHTAIIDLIPATHTPKRCRRSPTPLSVCSTLSP